MILALIVMLLGIFLGRIFRKSLKQSWFPPILMVVVCLLLFVMGCRVGTDPRIVGSLGSIGGCAAVLSLAGMAGSIAIVSLLTGWIEGKRQLGCRVVENSDGNGCEPGGGKPKEHSQGGGAADSLIILASFVAGVAVAFFNIIPSAFSADLEKYSTLFLYVLLIVVGLSVGGDASVVAAIRHLPRRSLLLPLFTFVGTIAGTLLAFWALQLAGATGAIEGKLLNALTVNSGLGYYSLTGIMVGERLGAQIGSVALVANLLRELITILCAPLLSRWFGKYAIITAGGATVSDTTLPMIIRCEGNAMLPVAVYNGIAVSVAVPVVLSLLLML